MPFGTCRDCGIATKGECLKLLDFTYVNHDMAFNQKAKTGSKKYLITKMDVEVLINLGLMDTIK